MYCTALSDIMYGIVVALRLTATLELPQKLLPSRDTHSYGMIVSSNTGCHDTHLSVSGLYGHVET